MNKFNEKEHTVIPQKSITLVEDSKIIQKALVPFLENLGFVVYSHTSGESALASSKTFHSDILFTDLNLETHMKGDELIATIAAHTQKKTFFILASASDTKEYAEQLREKGIEVVELNKKEITHLRNQISALIKQVF